MPEQKMQQNQEITNMQAETTEQIPDPRDAGRRQFVNQALAVSAGVAFSGFFPHLKAAPLQGAGAKCAPIFGKELVNPGEIPSGPDGILHAVLRVHGEDRLVSYLDVNGANPNDPPPACGTYKLRAYEGYKGTKVDKSQMVTKPGVYNPGPTFRAHVGDTLQIAFLNHIDPKDFPETADQHCDLAKNSSGTEMYPGKNGKPPCPDSYPDCFRGSNTTNLHFHGTHVSPNAFSDNVLVEVVPDLQATPAECDHFFQTIACKDYPNPQAWRHVDAKSAQELQTLVNRNQDRLKKLDQIQPEPNDKTLHTRQAAQNVHLQEYGEFPQYWSGCFPYCIRPPKYVPPPIPDQLPCPPQPEPKPQYVMGQAPGTHWYHAHKHGSTSIQVYNGMAGAMILEGDYDVKLRQTMPGVQEKVLVIQQFQQQPNRERTGGAGGASAPNAPVGFAGSLVNGQLQPVITMKANEVQWWRIINGTVQGGKDALFNCGFGGPDAPKFYQTAQDGVQFHWDNYQSQLKNPNTTFTLAPGNRVDILVQAPSKAGTANLVYKDVRTTPTGTNIILTVNVIDPTNEISYNQRWPQTKDQYPEMPPFLHDIEEVSECRIIKYQMDTSKGPGAPPLINGRRFEEGRIDEAMLLDTRQEWTVQNYSAGLFVRHPFHIHVNPFQVTEVFDPSTMTEPLKLPQPWIWWDTFPIPLGKKDSTGKVIPGYFKMRTHFADFAGKFVNHCHILAHEDRGMMQLIEVVDNKTQITHH
jgi:FtsP/CotA-like multicopper oxidase with cupredoxin domain